MSKKVAIVQSNYIPWKGYFDLINMADEFILFDDLQYTKRDWRNRNIIKTVNGLMWLTIPVEVRGRYLQAINETTISNPAWNRGHWKTVAHCYARARYFQHYKGIFEDLYLGSSERYLSIINHKFIIAVCDILGINTRISRSTDYDLVQGKTERIIGLCKQTGASEYISGPTAKGYLEEGLFQKEGIVLRYADYSNYPEYRQLFPPFEHRVSIIDLIFNEGPNASVHEELSSMSLSIVTTLFNSAANLEEFYARIVPAARKVTDDYEIILVNDGSPDNSLELAISLYERDHRVTVIDLSRNFGHHKAMMTGLAEASGELVFLLDSDLEEEPELLETFHAELKACGADVVFGVQQKRKGKLFERVSGNLFFKLFNFLSAQPIPPNLITARLMSRRYVSALVQHHEREMIIAGLWALTGFKQVSLVVRKHHRSATTYDLRSKIAHLVNAVTSFSNKPLVFIFYVGCFILLLSSIAALDLIIRRIFFGKLLQGWASLIVSIWLLGGMTLFSLGVIGIYLSKVFIETKQRPYTIIKEVYQRREHFPRLQAATPDNPNAERADYPREA